MIRSLFRRHRVASVTVVVLAVLLLTAAAAELTARTLLHDRLAAAAGRALGKDSEIDVEGGPALLDVFDRHLDAVDISSDDATVARIPDVSVHARLDDIRMTGAHSGTVAHTHADVAIPAASLQDVAGGPGSRLQVTGVRLDDKADTITLDLQGGLGQATLQPRIEDGRLSLHLTAVEILGQSAPATLVDRLENRLTDRAKAHYPLGLRVTAADVTTTGLTVTLDGGPSPLPGKNEKDGKNGKNGKNGTSGETGTTGTTGTKKS